MTIDALVFDFDGLILDTELPAFVSLRAAFAAHGAELPTGEFRDRIGTTDKLHWTLWLEEVLGHDIDREAAREARLDHHHALIAEQAVRPGVVALLDEARSLALPVGVASSSPRDWVEGHLEQRGLLERFSVVVTSDDVERTKPAPDLYRAALAALGAGPERAVALEDSAHGCTAAVTAGLFCVAVPNPVTQDQDFSHADLVVSSLADIGLARLAGELGRRVTGGTPPSVARRLGE